MARQKEFDQEKALDRAMRLFWQKGYEATSIQDLVDHLGIGRRSLYDTFKSKHDLFIAALDRYRQMTNNLSTAMNKELQASPKVLIRRIFELIIEEAVNDQDRCGCFVVNSAVELARHDDAVAVRVREAMQRMEDDFYALLVQAQKNGELNATRDLRDLAQFLVNAVYGIRVQAKINPERQLLTTVANLTLSVLD
ncbi:TetR/AcrR family transcriptional regulator [Chloroflexi bacterium TSY]|nr:TetR/AcrR family transcriptional regulator [Chloroflexi bacterium TSY]